MKKAFSLAEVLIAITIVGVVCVLAIPTFIDSYQKKMAPLYVKKFYSEMQQVLMLAKMRNSHCEITNDMRGNSRGFINWYNRCLSKYMSDTHVEYPEGSIYGLVVFSNNSAFYGYVTDGAQGDIVHFFFCTQKKYCGVERYDGRTSFLFSYLANDWNDGYNTFKAGFFTAFPQLHTLSRDDLLSRCKYSNFNGGGVSYPNQRHTCARLIEVDGWKLKEDYPWEEEDIKNKK